jgi:PAS domain S-box-containing protein
MLQKIAERLGMTRTFVQRLHSTLESSPLGLSEVEELVEHLNNALEEVQTLYETVCEQSESLAAAVASAHAERERYRYLFDHAPEAYIVTDVHGVIREANTQAAVLLNTPTEFLVDVPFASFVQAEQRPVFRRDFLRIGSVERIEEWRVALQPHNMPLIQASLTVTTVPDPTGRLTVLRWMIRDATERTSVATLWRAARGRQHAVCTVAKTERGLEVVIQTEGVVQIRELFTSWEEVLRRAATLRATMKSDGWQDMAVVARRAHPRNSEASTA